MKIFVDKLPDCCAKCLFYGQFITSWGANCLGCTILQNSANLGGTFDSNEEREYGCPLAELNQRGDNNAG